MRTVPLAKAEDTTHGLEVVVPAGTRVDLGTGWFATVTQEGLDCDCGKGVLCPYNPAGQKVVRPKPLTG